MAIPQPKAQLKTTADVVMDQIAQKLTDIFSSSIKMNDVDTKTETEKRQYFLTRSYSALALLRFVNISSAQAGFYVTDGGCDDGIDAVGIDMRQKKIVFVQSKWSKNTNKGIKLTDFTRFRDGVKRVISAQWDDNNADLHKHKNEIEILLRDIDLQIILVFAHTSEQEIAKNTRNVIDEFVVEQNRLNPEFIKFEQFGLQDAVKIARSFARLENINLSILLGNWGEITSPYRAVYGSVAASDLVQWYETYENRLFSENLRFGLEKSEINDSLINTVKVAPEHFWYFNNGVTAVSDSYKKQPVGGTSTISGIFDITKISIINGAQTISSLSRAKEAGCDLENVRVQVRIISLDDTPDGFSVLVTNANNTQNNLNPVDFIAADPNQERLRREAAAERLTYSFRRGDSQPDPERGFDVRTATIALACASTELRLAVLSKRYISGLWENPKREPYTKLFNDNTKAKYIWHCVSVMNTVDSLLKIKAEQNDGKERLIAVHGNRFILFYIFSSIGEAALTAKSRNALVRLARTEFEVAFPKIVSAVLAIFPDAYPGNIFKNVERQQEVLAFLDL